MGPLISTRKGCRESLKFSLEGRKPPLARAATTILGDEFLKANSQPFDKGYESSCKQKKSPLNQEGETMLANTTSTPLSVTKVVSILTTALRVVCRTRGTLGKTFSGGGESKCRDTTG